MIGSHLRAGREEPQADEIVCHAHVVLVHRMHHGVDQNLHRS